MTAEGICAEWSTAARAVLPLLRDNTDGTVSLPKRVTLALLLPWTPGSGLRALGWSMKTLPHAYASDL